MDSNNTRYGNNILIEFNCMIDIDLAVIKLIQIKYANKEFMRDEILNADEYTIMSLLQLRKESNPISIIIKDEYKSSIDNLYSEIIKNDYIELLRLSKTNTIYDLMNLYLTTDGIISVTVLCTNNEQVKHITMLSSKKKDNSKMKTIKDDYTIDTKRFDSIFIYRFEDILKYTGIEGKSIFIPKYKFNMEENNKEIPLLRICAYVSDINKVYTLDAYMNLVLPSEESDK